MANPNLNEVGVIIRVNVGEDISLSTPTLFLEPEFGLLKEFQTGVTIPNVTVEDKPGGTPWNTGHKSSLTRSVFQDSRSSSCFRC